MSKPRVFISSTCYDLKSVRSELTEFLESYNLEVINSQLKNFGVTPQKHSHSACLDQVKNADYLFLIIGRRRGGTFIGSEKSITNEEYNLAIKIGIPIIIFADKGVYDAIPIYKKNPTSDFKSIVNDTRIFHFIDYINAGSEDNWIHVYDNVNDIKDILRSQFAYYLLLFSQGLRSSIKKEKTADSTKLVYVKYPSNIEKIIKKTDSQEEETAIRNGVRELHKIFVNILSSDGKDDNKREKLKTMWVIAKHGEFEQMGEYLLIDNNIFKDFAWSTSKGGRVLTQMKPFGIFAEYDEDISTDILYITLNFKNQNEECDICLALVEYVERLIKVHGNDDGYELFMKADMRLFMK